MRFFKLFSPLLLLFLLQVSVMAQSAQPYAVYMYSFTRYINWPANAEGDFLLGVLGDTPVTPHLEKMATQKKVNGRTIRLIIFDSPAEINQDLDMLFVNEEWSDAENDFINELDHCLVVTQGTSEQGNSHMNFIQEDGRLLFELNKSELDKSGFRISSELLALARVVDQKQSN